MSSKDVKTYNTEAFKDRFMQHQDQLENMLRNDFGKFFMVRVEEMFRLMKLPVPPTRATTHTIIFITEGEANMHIGSETFKIFKNECLVVPAGQVFSFASPDVNKGYLCNFHHDFIIGKFGKSELLKDFEFLTVWGNPHIRLSAENADFTEQLFKRILRDYLENGLKNIDILQSSFIAILCELNHAYKPLSDSTQTFAVNITVRFKALLSAHFKSSQQVSDYAVMLSITPNHLNKCLRTITGKSPTKWIDEAIILEAKVLLSQTALSVNEITTELGLSDPSYFSRFFRKYEGRTPLEFRKHIGH
ncbi:helix-turn-helix domain-containing protein [Emticicia sp. CRIBPO]|uniref:helix-turn-helix domain-containing protein n=1 Tax=Emticicia sp. CRIBPO TaxID=2683258 RepID=UPI001411F73A|nr:helix-turn-helix domain-containing protein [Emticicia sp. CRIBPO]NBA87780.1 helix-turn-helix domain-containing protein [Emticicia sp. CRIBPO]